MKIQDITKQDVKQRGLITHEPRWMREQREESWRQFQFAPDINWKKSKTPELETSTLSFAFPTGDIAPLKVEKKPPEGYAGKITFKDGKVWRISLDSDLAYKGVIFCDMQTAVLERADLMDRYLVNSKWGQEDKLSFFHKALWENGYFLFIPKGLVVDKTFQVQIIQSKEGNNLLFRNLIIADKSGSCVIEELQESEDSKKTSLCAMTTEVFLEENSSCKYYSSQQWGKEVYDLSTRRFVVKKNAKLKALFALLGSRGGRVSITGDATEEGASIEHNGIMVAGDQERFKIIAKIDHQAHNTEGMMKYRGILKDESYSDLDGLISVQSTGNKSHSRLEEHTLLLSEKARCDALPALDIKTDDVLVSHSASVSQADEEQIFYLMSRGLSEKEAKTLLVQGFFEGLLADIPNHCFYESVKNTLESKLFAT